jgi:hypothetical protein
MSKSIYNNSTTPLNSNEVFRGLFEECNQDFVEINVDLKTDTNSLLVIEQSNDKTNVIKRNIYDYVAGSIEPYITTITTTYFRVIVRNTSDMNQQYLSLTSYIEAIVNGNVLQVLNTEGLQTKLLSNLEGHLIVDTSSTSGTTSNVNIKSFETSLPAGENTIGSVVINSIVSNITIAGVSNQDGETYDISLETELRPSSEPPNQTIHKLETYDYTAIQSLESIDSKLTTGILTQGENTDFAFFPDTTNSTSSIYADAQPPVQTTPAGWVYTNNGVSPNKINWYVYQNATQPQYLVSQMKSIYFVISQLPTATTLPYIVMYTMPDGLDDFVPNFAKSVLVFATNGNIPTSTGLYLLYVNEDPVNIHPEITNRFQLSFINQNSSKTLEQAGGERISTTNISTNSTDPAGSNLFLFQQYGIVWEKSPVSIPVNDGKVDCNIVSLPAVVLGTSTADIGFVNLKAENLSSNPPTFSNLQIQGQYLEVEDQQAITFLGSIEGNSNSIRLNTDLLVNYNQSMESRLVNMDTKMITLSNGASTKTLTQTGANWTDGYSTLQSLTISNVGGSQFDYVKLYNKATAPDQNDTPVMTIPIHTDRTEQVICNTLLFDLGIGVRATNDFVANDNTIPSGTIYATAFYKFN